MAVRCIWCFLRPTSRPEGQSILTGTPARTRFFTCKREPFGCIWETLLGMSTPALAFLFLPIHGFLLLTLGATPSVLFVFFPRRASNSLSVRHQRAKERKTFR